MDRHEAVASQTHRGEHPTVEETNNSDKFEDTAKGDYNSGDDVIEEVLRILTQT